MNRTEVRDALFPRCPIRNVLSRIGDKWSMLVLFTLEDTSCQRFKQLQRNIPDISQKMLTATLKTLEADGLVKREAYAESGSWHRQTGGTLMQERRLSSYIRPVILC